jgi:hypothetical protein
MGISVDFTPQIFTILLDSLCKNGYSFQSVEDFVTSPSAKVVILRHDVDRNAARSFIAARLENEIGIKGTYYFRIVNQSNNPDIIKKIAALGHEIGYHYEDYSFARGDADAAIVRFKENVDYFRSFYPVRTICVHGSPMSAWNNLDLWKSYSYYDYGIIAEPYKDLDFETILYLTDTGRKWNGFKVSFRDKVQQDKYSELKKKLKHTFNIIDAVRSDQLPDRLMLTVHPQRWIDNPILWIHEYTFQGAKNLIKRLILS